MPSPSEFLSLRRQYVQAIIQLSNAHQGGSVSLVNVTEQATWTDLEFELSFPIRDHRTPDRLVRRVLVSVEMPEDTVDQGASRA